MKFLRLAGLLAAWAVFSGPALPVRGQEPVLGAGVNSSAGMISNLALWDRAQPEKTQTARLHLFNMPTGYLSNPLDIMNDDDLTDPTAESKSSRVDDDLSFLQVAVGPYNPNFDIRLPGDPHRLGYYKVHSQLQVLDQDGTSVSLGLQACTPAGQQMGGVSTGPTTFSPGIALFQELGGGTAFHGYFGQSLQANSRLGENLTSGLNYGLAMQYPLLGSAAQKEPGLFLFVQALGRYRYDGYATDGRTSLWEVVPGVHWRWNDNCWMSLGVSHYNFLSCNWQF